MCCTKIWNLLFDWDTRLRWDNSGRAAPQPSASASFHSALGQTCALMFLFLLQPLVNSFSIFLAHSFGCCQATAGITLCLALGDVLPTDSRCQTPLCAPSASISSHHAQDTSLLSETHEQIANPSFSWHRHRISNLMSTPGTAILTFSMHSKPQTQQI